MSGDEEHSDDDDVFQMTAASSYSVSDAYRGFWLYRWQLAEEELQTQLRDEVLLPLDPSDPTATTVFTNVEEAVVLPPWHCPFRACCAAETDLRACDKHENRLWHHIWHGASSDVPHVFLLREIIFKHNLKQTFIPERRHLEELAFTLLSGALLAKERELCPRLGLTTDRRTLGHIGEIFHEDKI